MLRSTRATWASVNSILPASTAGWESDTGRWKLGDGLTPWLRLVYQTGPAAGVAGVPAVATVSEPSSYWTSNNPILPGGVTGWESDTGKWKLGNGSTAWAGLVYQTGTAAGIGVDPTVEASGPGGSTPVVNDLTSGGTSSALSAQQGVVLKAQIDAVSGSNSSLVAVAGVTVPAGKPLAVNPANGQLVVAIASSKPFASVAGLASAAATVGFPVTAATGLLSLPDWTAITGTVALQPGQYYFLAAGGGLTTIPPSKPNCITLVGMADSVTTLSIRPQPPIQL